MTVARWLSVLLLALPLRAEVTLHVAPNGNDAWSGRLAQPNAARTDGPLASLAGARDRVRALKGGGAPAEPMRVLFATGTYRQTAPVVYEPADSGSPQCPITYAAEPGARPVISGGRAVSGWQREAGDRFSVMLPEAAGHRWVFQQLWVNGQRRLWARSPNTGYFHLAGKAGPLIGPDGKQVDRSKSAFRYHPGEISNWPDLGDVNVMVYDIWESSITPLKAVDEASHTVTLAGDEKWAFGWCGPEQRFVVFNAPDALDAPGEWQLDRRSGKLSAIAPAGEDLARADAVAPVASQLVVIKGDAEAGLWVDSLRFEGLSFQHTNWVTPPQGHCDWQAAVTIDAALQADGARNCQVDRCEVAHIGNYGIWFRNGCQSNAVTQCELWDLGAGGVRFGPEGIPPAALATGGNRVENCYIHDGGHIFPGAIGVWVGQSSDNQIAHNEIADLNYTGISVGWSWGFNPTTCHRNRIEYNRLHHLGQNVLSDMGAIYTLGISTGSVVRNNYITDIYGYEQSGASGIYPDEGSTGILYENNVTWRTAGGGFSMHYGRELMVRNNIFGLGRDYTVSRGRKDKQSSSTLEGNIFVWRGGSLVVGSADMVTRRNVFHWLGDEAPGFPGDLSFADWQKAGYDADSVVADPLLTDPDHGDFTLKPGSPALKLGFQPIDVRQAGLTGPDEWRRRPLAHQQPPWAMPERPKPEPLALNDGFEEAAVGTTADHAVTYGETATAAVRVTDERAATGKHSLKFQDQPGLDYVFNPHLWYTPNHQRGTLRFSLDLLQLAGAVTWIEWRDASNPYRTGPGVEVSGQEVKVKGKAVGRLPWGLWGHLEMSCALGKAANGKWSFRATLPDQPPVSLDDLPCDPKFNKLEWLGIVANADATTAFFVDNVKLEVVKP